MDDEILDYETTQIERDDDLNTDDEDDLMTDSDSDKQLYKFHGFHYVVREHAAKYVFVFSLLECHNVSKASCYDVI